FQICVEESSPCAIMTSYNLLNGIHTSERSDLLKTVVRGEWGYDGLIMTDWVISAMADKGKYRGAKSAPTIKAGNDVFMPGSPADYKTAMNALQGKDKEFSLTRTELVYCAEHVVDMVLRLTGV
ncbi:MAG: beta-glucosidase, partial [Lachnospiraceae bacterium]|nr:beta-glucosidase [Lachnospiraceae bacterium]